MIKRGIGWVIDEVREIGQDEGPGLALVYLALMTLVAGGGAMLVVTLGYLAVKLAFSAPLVFAVICAVISLVLLVWVAACGDMFGRERTNDGTAERWHRW